MHLLLTNDDGIGADGLAALYQAANTFGRVTVVAPRQERSSGGHAVTNRGLLTVTSVADPRLGKAYACDGTPADCVRLALAGMGLEPVDWVLAGVNKGANLGIDVFYSGTIAAVREAAFLGYRGISVSQFVRVIRDGDEPEWGRVAERVRHLLGQLLSQPGDRPTMWSINLPLAEGRAPGIQVTTLSRDPWPMKFERVESGDGEARYRYCGAYADRVGGPGTDVAAVLGGDIALTPLGLEGTDPAGLGLSFDAPPA